jgi:hypothetical protein
MPVLTDRRCPGVKRAGRRISRPLRRPTRRPLRFRLWLPDGPIVWERVDILDANNRVWDTTESLPAVFWDARMETDLDRLIPNLLPLEV